MLRRGAPEVAVAIPALFPAVRVTTPTQAPGWYFDGGPRLNTPIKPALWLGAERVIVIALNSVASSIAPDDCQPDFYVGAAHLLHAALGDPLAQDIRTLANRNALIGARLAAGDGHSGASLAARRAQPGGVDEPVQPVPYIFIAPEDPAAIGVIAQRVYRKHYRRPWNAGGRDLWLLGKVLDAGADAMHGELLSYVFFAGEFAEELIALGQADAQRWIDRHPSDLWQLDPLPDWPQQPPTATPMPSAPRSEREHVPWKPRGSSPSAHASGATVRELPQDPVIDMPSPLREFAVTLSDGRRVVGRERDAHWSIYVYAPDSEGRLLASGSAPTRLHALEQAGVCGDDAGEVLGRAGI